MVLALCCADLVDVLIVADIAPVAYGRMTIRIHRGHARPFDLTGLSAVSALVSVWLATVDEASSRAVFLQSAGFEIL